MMVFTKTVISTGDVTIHKSITPVDQTRFKENKFINRDGEEVTEHMTNNGELKTVWIETELLE
jgi:hypothetical protein